jgi:hypothetical protein
MSRISRSVIRLVVGPNLCRSKRWLARDDEHKQSFSFGDISTERSPWSVVNSVHWLLSPQVVCLSRSELLAAFMVVVVKVFINAW